MLDRNCLFSIPAVLACLLLSVQATLPSSIDPKNTLECHRREYTYMATKTDFDGRRCWDYLRVMSCWGRCDSYEIPDWRFPFKKSYHPVCLHENTELRRVTLRHCDPGTDLELRNYEYVEALTCSCHICNTSSASCEAPHQMRKHPGLHYATIADLPLP